LCGWSCFEIGWHFVDLRVCATRADFGGGKMGLSTPCDLRFTVAAPLAISQKLVTSAATNEIFPYDFDISSNHG
jgi:hypothetical protein